MPCPLCSSFRGWWGLVLCWMLGFRVCKRACRGCQKLVPLTTLERKDASSPLVFGQGACASWSLQDHPGQQHPQSPGSGGLYGRLCCQNLFKTEMHGCPDTATDEGRGCCEHESSLPEHAKQVDVVKGRQCPAHGRLVMCHGGAVRGSVKVLRLGGRCAAVGAGCRVVVGPVWC